MSLLRIFASLSDQPQRCHWALLDAGRHATAGEDSLADLPRHAGRVQLVIPAAQVLLAQVRLPDRARRTGTSVLAFAVEERTAGDPDASQVSWLGSSGGLDALAVVEKSALARWQEALAAAGTQVDEVHCETLMLPMQAGEWSMVWNGSDGFVRRAAFEGASTDCGGRDSPPLALRLMLEEAAAGGVAPTAIALHATAPDAVPDLLAWQRELGIPFRLAATWDWRTAPTDAGVRLAQPPRRWRRFSGAAQRLRPAAWILGAALALHAIALVIDWTQLAGEQRELRQQMEARFRASFPEAVAVVDPALQMRRMLAAARHGAGQADAGDFLPLAAQVAAATTGLPPSALRVMSYESGQMRLEIVAAGEAMQRIVSDLRQAGLAVELANEGTRGPAATAVIRVRAP